jgi:chromosomal replication initiator protein
MKVSSEKIDLCNSILHKVSEVSCVSVPDILSTSRTARIVQARHLSMYFCRFHAEVNTKTIATLHRRDNHATVLHACQNIHKDLRFDKNLKAKFNLVEDFVKAI